jgi:hypothetical protein|nr:hypothetical protein [Neorhizobium tomejilense]
MLIRWNKNPIRTTVELSDGEKEVFLLKARLRECEDTIRSALFHLDGTRKHGKYFNVERAVAFLTHPLSKKQPDEDSALEMLASLECGFHCGDCTCVASPCERCFAEDILGIDTIKGLRQHEALMIDSAFGKDGERSIDEALAVLAARARKTGNEVQGAHDWLFAYKAEKQIA